MELAEGETFFSYPTQRGGLQGEIPSWRGSEIERSPGMTDLSKVAVVIRSYGNIRLQNRLDEIKNWGVARIFVISNPIKDNGVTDIIVNGFDPRLVKHLPLTNYSWSSALNAAMAGIAMVGPNRDAIRYILNASVEAEFEQHHIEKMLEHIEDHIAVGTSFFGFCEKDSIRESIWLGYTYKQPRNTGMLINLNRASGPLGFFNPKCDDWDGMEDTEFLLRALLHNKSFVNLDLKVPLLIRDSKEQTEKEGKEKGANEKIKYFVRWLAPERADEVFGKFDDFCKYK